MTTIKQVAQVALFFLVSQAIVLPKISAQFAGAHPFFNNNSRTFIQDALIDMDGDGDKDLITHPQNPSSTFLLSRNDGQGNFSPEEILADNMIYAEFFDWNGDGFPDMSAINTSTFTRNIYLNQGDGTLGNSIVEIPGYVVRKSVRTDFDLDGDLDVLLQIGSAWDSQIAWLQNDGFENYTFTVLETISTDFSMTTADINQDGFLDVCIAYQRQNKFGWFANDGFGNLRPFEELSTGFPTGISSNISTNGILSADLDADGDLDFFCWSQDQQKLVWLANDGAAQFGAAQLITDTLPLSYLDMFAQVGDVDGDGDTDIVMAIGNLFLFRNDGTGNFSQEEVLTFGYNNHPLGLYLEDINGDGTLDVLTSRYDEVFWFPNDGTGHFGQQRFAIANIIPEPESIDMVDVDADGRLDMTFCSPMNGLSGWYPQLPDGNFGALRSIETLSDYFQDVAFADMDGDGLLDALCVSYKYQELRIYPNLGNGNFGPFTAITLDATYAVSTNVHCSDADADGDQDIFLSGQFGATYAILMLRNAGNGSFDPEILTTQITTGGYCHEEHPDFNHDGHPDLLFQENYTSALRWCPNDGTGHYGPIQNIDQTDNYLSTKVADLDNDSIPDILVSNENGEIYWLKYKGNWPEFVKNDIIANNYGHFSIATADFDGDGDNDIWASSQVDSQLVGNRIFIYKNDGAGQFQLDYSFEDKTVDHYATNVADIDGDGDPDVYFGAYLRNGWYENLRGTALLSGFCFHDANGNGQQDTDESFLADIVLDLQPAALQTFTLSDGTFQFFVSSGDYTLSYQPHPCWNLTTDSAVYHLSYDGGLFSGKTFGFSSASNDRFVAPQISGSFPRCGATVPFWFDLKNTSCNAASGKFTLVTNNLVTFAGASIPPIAINGDTIMWDLDTLAASHSTQIEAYFSVAPANFVGDTIRMSGQVFLKNDAGMLEPSGSDHFESIISCAYDPNDKIVNRTIVPENYTAGEAELRYTVRFQNTGNDTASLVRIRDTLDPHLDWTTLRPLGSSHPNTVALDYANGRLELIFENIGLPDSTTNERESHGFTSFAIQMKPGLPAGTKVNNAASIYFDFNPAILTNTAETEIVAPMVPVSPEPQVGWSVRISPNPTAGIVTVTLPQPVVTSMLLVITDLTGRLLIQQQFVAGNTLQTMDASELPTGFYFLQVVSENKVLTVEKFVKE